MMVFADRMKVINHRSVGMQHGLCVKIADVSEDQRNGASFVHVTK